MSPFQVLCVIAFCGAIFIGIVITLMSHGVSLPMALLGVYLFAVGCMLGMQRRARESSEGIERGLRRRFESSRQDGVSSGADTWREDDTSRGERTSGYSGSSARESLRAGAYRV